MNTIKKIFIIIILIFIFKKLLKKKFRTKENFEKLGFSRVNNGGCQDYQSHQLNQYLTNGVDCYMKCNNNINCSEYFFRPNGKDVFNDRFVNCYLVDKTKGKCQIDANNIYEHYVKNNDVDQNLYIDNYILLNPEYDKHLYSSVFNNDEIGTGNAKARFNSDSALSFDKSRAVDTNKGKMHWLQLDMNGLVNVGGLIIQGRNENQYPKKVSLKLSETGDDWDNRPWEKIYNNLPIYSSNNISLSRNVGSILNQNEIYVTCNLTTPKSFSLINNIFLIGGDDSCGAIIAYLNRGVICFGNSCDKMLIQEEIIPTPTPLATSTPTPLATSTPTPLATSTPTLTPPPNIIRNIPVEIKNIRNIMVNSSPPTIGNKLATNSDYKLDFYYNKITKVCKIWVNDVVDVHNIDVNYSIPIGKISIGTGSHNEDKKTFEGFIQNISIYNFLQKNGNDYKNEYGIGVMGPNTITRMYIENPKRAKYVRIYLGENSYYGYPSIRAGVLVKYIYDNVKLLDLSTKWINLMNPATAAQEKLPFSNEEKQLYYRNRLNYKLYKHINETWYYNNKSLCIPYVIDKDFSEKDCNWTIPVKGFWFKNAIDTRPTLSEAKNRLLEMPNSYAISYHPNIGDYGTYFIHGSSLKLSDYDQDFEKITTYFYLPRSSKVDPIFYLEDLNENKVDKRTYSISNKEYLSLCNNVNKECNRNLFYCPGGKKFGNIQLQRNAILNATIDIINGKKYHNCPSVLNVLPTSDKIGVIVTPLKLIIDENDDGKINLVLTSKPNSDVNISVNYSDLGELTGNKDIFKFTNLNWNLPQELIVNAINDYEINEDVNLKIKFKINSIDDNYNSLQDIIVDVSKFNDDKADLMIVPQKLEILEGKEKEINIFLNTKPKEPVVVNVSYSNSFNVNQLNIKNDTIIFNDLDWNLKKPIFVSGTIDNLVDGDIDIKLILILKSKDPYYNNMKKIVDIKVIDDGIDPTLYFSHDCNVCSCSPDNPLECHCKKCVKKYFNPLFPTPLDISTDKINEILSSFYSRYNKLKNIGNLEETGHFLCNLNRFYFEMEEKDNFLLDKIIYAKNIQIRELINKYIQNINNIDYSIFSKIKLTDQKEIYFNDLLEIYNLGGYYYENYLTFKFTFDGQTNESEIRCTLNLLYVLSEKLWITVNIIDIKPNSLDYL